MVPVMEMNGVGEVLQVFDDKITITPKGVLGFLAKGLKGTKTIPIASITAIQFRKAGLVNGYLQFTIPGGDESRGGALAAASDENTFMFSGPNEGAVEIMEFIEARMKTLRQGDASFSGGGVAAELQRLADLKTKGMLSEEEFAAAKKRLLGELRGGRS
jgi:hypothetical protein